MTVPHRLSRILNHQTVVPYSTSITSSLIKVDLNCPVYTYINGLRKQSSQDTARSVLQSIARHLNQQSLYDINWANFDLHTMNQLVLVLESAGLAPDTIVLYGAIVKGVLKKAYLLEQISQLQYDRICSVNLPLAGGKRNHEIISFDDFEIFLQQFSGHFNAQRRNMAIFSLLIGCGLRRFEVTRLLMTNLDLINSRLQFSGKGGKVRQVAMHPKTLARLKNWLAVRGNSPGPVFMRIYKNDAIDRSFELSRTEKKNADKKINDSYSPKDDLSKYCLSNHSIYKLCQKFGLMDQSRHIPPHSIRRSYATRLYNNHVDLKIIAGLMGHSSIKTTELYVHVAQDQMDEAITNHLF